LRRAGDSMILFHYFPTGGDAVTFSAFISSSGVGGDVGQKFSSFFILADRNISFKNIRRLEFSGNWIINFKFYFYVVSIFLLIGEDVLREYHCPRDTQSNENTKDTHKLVLMIIASFRPFLANKKLEWLR